MPNSYMFIFCYYKYNIINGRSGLDFVPISTEDGTISLYNFSVQDVYHSKVGAYTEALYKYTLPSGLLEFVKYNNEVKILDVCFGLGYNSKVAVAEILKINPECRITINAIEIDPVVLAFSCIVDILPHNIQTKFFNVVSNQIDINVVLENYFKEINNNSLNIEQSLPKEYKTINLNEINQKLHNIYYRTISSRNTRQLELNTANDLLTINIFIDDARKIIKQLNTQHDFIFHDPFTPSKLPTLWTVDFFKEIYRLLKENGNLTTYSSAAPVRAGLFEAGFSLGRSEPIGKKTSGTIAYKKNDLLINPLTKDEKEILKTTAGIPYYDRTLSETPELILKNREISQKNSDRISSSQFMKSKKKYD